jgi:oligoribonuclease NrnB/cAMP/cGMP phosphodiesterase (DHH superfamily)
MKKITIIHHSADFDGLFCREIAKKFLTAPDVDLTVIGWDWGQPQIPFPDEGMVYVLDLSPDCLTHTPQRAASALIWIDHHKSAIEKWPTQILGYRIDGVAACRLAWQWFTCETKFIDCRHDASLLPEKQAYVDRAVVEPYSVRLAGEYDIWDHRDPNAKVFQFGLRSVEAEHLSWERLLTADSQIYVDQLLSNGRLLQRYQQQNDAAIITKLGFLVEFEGLKFLALNTTAKNSQAFDALDKPETGHDALLKFNWTGKVWDVSMYHAKHRTDLDLSAIAVKRGGGGHRGACGFRSESLPFVGPKINNLSAELEGWLDSQKITWENK